VRLYRIIEKINWTEHTTNEEVLAMIGEEGSLITTIRKRQNKRMGHTKWRLTVIGTVMKGKVEGKNTKERLRQIMQDLMLADSYRKLKEKT